MGCLTVRCTRLGGIYARSSRVCYTDNENKEKFIRVEKKEIFLSQFNNWQDTNRIVSNVTWEVEWRDL